MEGSNKNTKKRSIYSRFEGKLLEALPLSLSPLRFRVLLGYLLVLVLALYGWEQLATAWRYLVTLLAPATAVIGALFALKLSVVFVSLFTLLLSLSKVLFGFLVVVLKPGILKAIFIPQLISVANWVHRKSERLQKTVRKIYDWGKERVERMLEWWKKQALLDKILLSGFIVPLLVLVLLVFVVKRAIAIFAVKKLTEQIVQKSTKLVIKNFHKLPVVGGLPAFVAVNARKFTLKSDRDDVVDDLKALGRELPDLDGKVRPGNNQPSSK